MIRVLLALLAAASCIPPASTTVAYQYRLNQEFGGGEDPEPPMVEARQLLATARTVAFFPPDSCLNVDSGQHKASQLHASCGVLLSTLERAAERAGYEVVSWQNLRGDKRPIDFAREASVDALFEINEFDLETVDDSNVQRTLTFFLSDRASGVRPLPVTTQTAERCRAFAQQHDPNQTVALTGTIDIKTVSVSDGRARWRYRKTLSQVRGGTYPQVWFNAMSPATAEAALCDPAALQQAAAPVVAPGPAASEVTFTEQTGSDVNAKERSVIRDAMIAQFIDVLKDVHARKQP